MNPPATCPVCAGTRGEPVLSLGQVPVLCNQLWPDAGAARSAPTGRMDLTLCPDCGTIWNRAFDPERMDYAPGYENALHFSPRFRTFAETLAADLVARHDLVGKQVVEIGCGDGYFLDLMLRHGAAGATGFDPSMAGQATEFAARDGLEIIPENFAADQLDRSVDAILCRHVLEHIETPLAFLQDIRAAIGGRQIPVYFEVPNAGWMLDAVSIWDVIYEHVTYWTIPALDGLFRRAGFSPVSVRPGFGDQFLMIEARPARPDPSQPPGLTETLALARRFGAAAEQELAGWRARLSASKGKAVIWGAGSKGISFANALADTGALAALVDLNTRKHGRFAPGVGLPVVAPEALSVIRPALVLISNALYEVEIRDAVQALGLSPEFAVIAG